VHGDGKKNSARAKDEAKGKGFRPVWGASYKSHKRGEKEVNCQGRLVSGNGWEKGGNKTKIVG